MHLTATDALFWSERVGAIGVALGNAELLAVRGSFADGGILSLRVLRDREEFLLGGPRGVASLMTFPIVVTLIGMRLVCALLVLGLRGGHPVAVLSEGLIVLANVVVASMRMPGGDGSDQMLSVTMASIFLARAFADVWMTTCALWFLAAQACLAYAAAGGAKLVSRTWRDGTALQGIMRTASYGSHHLYAAISRNYGAALLLSWAVIVLETAFPLVLVSPRVAVYAFLGAGGLLHLGIALTMRLNVFVCAFLAPYPAIAFCAGALP